MNCMLGSSERGLFLSLIMVFSVLSVFSYNDTWAQEKPVEAKSFGFEKTSIIEFENKIGNSVQIETFRIWLGDEYIFQSFKTERGWIGNKLPQGVIVFTTNKPLEAGESVKFGIKTNKEKPGINWKALDKDGNELAIGKSLVKDNSNEEILERISPTIRSEGVGVFEESTFRLVPAKPNIGSNIRVTGDDFASYYNLEFFIDNTKLESFKTDKNGHFMLTSKIPDNENADRVEFVIKDSEGNKKTVSLRLGEGEDRMIAIEDIPLMISGTPSVVYRGDFVTVSGTALPGGTVTATIRDVNGETTSTIAVPVDLDGSWEYETLVSPEAPLGKFTAEITDGKDTILRSWIVESSKKIDISPAKSKYEPGETVIFSGTALPNMELQLSIEGPQGSEFYSDVFSMSESEEVNLEFLTQASYPQGTYVLYASQGDITEIVLVGLGEPPKEPLIVKMDSINYSAGTNATLSIQGPPSSTVKLIVIDPSEKSEFEDSEVKLGPEGHIHYQIDLTGYGSGVYTTVVTWANVQGSDVFSVGLQTGSGPVEVRTTKVTYQPGDPILILGKSGIHVLLSVTLLNPDGEVVKVKETFTNREGTFSEGSFRLPLDAQRGTWIIRAESGPNFDNAEITILENVEEGMSVSVIGIETLPQGKFVRISGYGAQISQSVLIEIFSPDETQLDEIKTTSTNAGEFSTLWQIPVDFEPGTYIVKVHDSINEAETTLDFE